MPNKKFQVPINLVNLNSDPATGSEGDMYFNTTLLQIRSYINGAWRSMASGTSTTTDATQVHIYVKNGTSNILPKGSVVYINGSDGTNVTVDLAQANMEGLSSKTLGFLETDLAANSGAGYVATDGILSGLNTNVNGANAGDAMWLSPTVAGGVLYGLANKPSAPNHLVYLGVMTKKSAGNGEIYVHVQNGFELEELHNVSLEADASIADNEVLAYDSATTLWKNQTPVEAGLAGLNNANAFTVGGHTITPSVAENSLRINSSTASQSSSILEVFNQSSNLTGYLANFSNVFVVSSGGRLGVRTTTLNGSLNVDTISATNVGAIIKSAVSQTANIQEWQNSSGTVLSGINGTAQIYTGSTSGILSQVGGTPLSATGSGTTSSITLSSPTNLVVGDLIVVSGFSGNSSGTYNTNGPVAVTFVQNSSPYVVSYLSSGVGNPTIMGTVSSYAQSSITTRSAGTKGLVIKGAASQSANLLEIQNSTAVGFSVGGANASNLTLGSSTQQGSINIYGSASNAFINLTPASLVSSTSYSQYLPAISGNIVVSASGNGGTGSVSINGGNSVVLQTTATGNLSLSSGSITAVSGTISGSNLAISSSSGSLQFTASGGGTQNLSVSSGFVSGNTVYLPTRSGTLALNNGLGWNKITTGSPINIISDGSNVPLTIQPAGTLGTGVGISSASVNIVANGTNIITVNFPSPTGVTFVDGSVVVIRNFTTSDFNGLYIVSGTTPTTLTLYNISGFTFASGTYTATTNSGAGVYNITPYTGDIQRWYNSAGTLVARIDNTGKIVGDWNGTSIPTLLGGTGATAITGTGNNVLDTNAQFGSLIYSYQPAPTTMNSSGTMTISGLQFGIITSTTASLVSAALPTGQLTETGLATTLGTTPINGISFDWTVINTGTTNTFTVTAGTAHTVIGNMVVQPSSQGRFRTRKSAYQTYVTYRIA